MRLYRLPRVQWLDNSEKELLAFGDQLVEKSEPVHMYFNERPLLVAGLYRPSLVGIPYLWVLLTEHFPEAPLSAYRYIREELAKYAPLQTLIEDDNQKARRLAQCLGLHPQGRWITVNETRYEIYGRGK